MPAAARSRRSIRPTAGRCSPGSSSELPDYFLQVRNIVYLSYYESPAVHEAIRAMGFTYNAIPLPRGYDVGRFDPATDLPRHQRGHFVATGDVKRVDLSQLDFLGDGHG